MARQSQRLDSEPPPATPTDDEQAELGFLKAFVGDLDARRIDWQLWRLIQPGENVPPGYDPTRGTLVMQWSGAMKSLEDLARIVGGGYYRIIGTEQGHRKPVVNESFAIQGPQRSPSSAAESSVTIDQVVDLVGQLQRQLGELRSELRAGARAQNSPADPFASLANAVTLIDRLRPAQPQRSFEELKSIFDLVKEYGGNGVAGGGVDWAGIAREVIPLLRRGEPAPAARPVPSSSSPATPATPVAPVIDPRRVQLASGLLRSFDAEMHPAAVADLLDLAVAPVDLATLKECANAEAALGLIGADVVAQYPRVQDPAVLNYLELVLTELRKPSAERGDDAGAA
jgi:hypothetical protein